MWKSRLDRVSGLAFAGVVTAGAVAFVAGALGSSLFGRAIALLRLRVDPNLSELFGAALGFGPVPLSQRLSGRLRLARGLWLCGSLDSLPCSLRGHSGFLSGTGSGGVVRYWLVAKERGLVHGRDALLQLGP